MMMFPTVNLVLIKGSSDIDPLGAVELAIGGGGNEIGGIVNSPFEKLRKVQHYSQPSHSSFMSIYSSHFSSGSITHDKIGNFIKFCHNTRKINSQSLEDTQVGYIL